MLIQEKMYNLRGILISEKNIKFNRNFYIYINKETDKNFNTSHYQGIHIFRKKSMI